MSKRTKELYRTKYQTGTTKNRNGTRTKGSSSGSWVWDFSVLGSVRFGSIGSRFRNQIYYILKQDENEVVLCLGYPPIFGPILACFCQIPPPFMLYLISRTFDIHHSSIPMILILNTQISALNIRAVTILRATTRKISWLVLFGEIAIYFEIGIVCKKRGIIMVNFIRNIILSI